MKTTDERTTIDSNADNVIKPEEPENTGEKDKHQAIKDPIKRLNKIIRNHGPQDEDFETVNQDAPDAVEKVLDAGEINNWTKLQGIQVISKDGKNVGTIVRIDQKVDIIVLENEGKKLRISKSHVQGVSRNKALKVLLNIDQQQLGFYQVQIS